MCAAVATDVVHHRTARWEKDSQRKPGKQASQPDIQQTSQPGRAEQRRSVSLCYDIIGWPYTNQGMSSRLIMFDLFDHMDF